MPDTRSRKPVARPVAKAREAVVSENSLPPLLVCYYRRMKMNKVYPVVVRWQKSKGRLAGDKQVTLRLLLAGAQVVPTERTLESDADAQATFFVTPLAHGWLRNHRLEVLHQGRKIQELPFSSRVVSQKATLLFFILMFLVPWFVLTYLKRPSASAPVRFDVPFVPIEDKEETAKKFFKENLPDLPGAVKQDYPDVYNSYVKGRDYFRDEAAAFYSGLCSLASNYHLAFYSFVGLLLVTLLSAWVHRDKRKTYKGKPLQLPRDEAAQTMLRRANPLLE